jgi:quercetin dioxygenase-like cupin family protein
MKTRCVRMLPALALVGLGAAAAHGQETVVPVYQEPHHRMVFESPSARILDVQVRPGETSGYHTHDSPILYVQLSSSQLRTEALGVPPAAPPAGRGRGAGRAGPAAAPPRPGRVSSTTSYVEQPVTHRITNVGDQLFRLIAVLTRLPGDDAVTPEEAGFSGAPEFANHWYRAYRFELAAGGATPMHHHTTPVVIVQVAEGRAVGAGASRFELTAPGTWAYFDAADAHQVRNTGAGAVEFVEVEVRSGRSQ